MHLILDAEYSNMDSSDPFDNTPRATVTIQDLSLEWNTGAWCPQPVGAVLNIAAHCWE